VPVILDGELSTLTDGADAKAKSCPAPHLKRYCRIMPGFYKRATQHKHRRVIDNSDAPRRAGIAAD